MDQQTWSARGGKPPAPGRRRSKPLVLVEEPSALAQVSDFSLFRQAGFDVAVCSGPRGPGQCPLTEEGHCELAGSADVILFGLDLEEAVAQSVLRAHRHHGPGTPVVVEASATRRGDVPDGDAGITVLHPSASVGGQVRALRRALRDAGWAARTI